MIFYMLNNFGFPPFPFIELKRKYSLYLMRVKSSDLLLQRIVAKPNSEAPPPVEKDRTVLPSFYTI